MKQLILKRVCAVALVGCLIAAGTVHADYIDEPIKWSQGPDMDLGVDHYSVHVGNAVCEDDYRCTDPRAVVAVRWWGSYLDGFEPEEGAHPTFEIAFHYDIPAGVLDPETFEVLHYSHPFSGPIYHVDVIAQEVYYGTTVGGERVYEYNAWLPSPFDQDSFINDPMNPVPGHNVFWMDIGYVDAVDPPAAQWGWHESKDQNIDFAISNPAWHFPPGGWANVTVLDSDLAFEIMVPEPATICLLGLGGLLLHRRRKT